MSFIHRIADASDIDEVFGLVNGYISAMQGVGEFHQIPSEVRPERTHTANDLSYWLRLVSEEIRRRDAAEEKTPDVMFALRAILETALQTVRSDLYH
jgi:hypothetical protein